MTVRTPDRAQPDVAGEAVAPYVLDDQIGFILRLVSQRHAAIFAARMGDVTAMQWAVMAKLAEVGPTSQNLLGRLTAMDVATIKGVVDRLMARGFLGTTIDVSDARRRLVALTSEGRAFYAAHVADALEISKETVAGLDAAERAVLRGLLERMR